MRIPRIYTGQDLGEGLSLALESGPAAHVARVLRMGEGDALVLFNGDGSDYPATITRSDKRSVEVTLGAPAPTATESPLAVELGIGISRGDRMDWVLQKATELGVSAVVPLFTERCEVKLKGERAEKKVQHWRQVVISACEQCGRSRLPRLDAPRSLDEWLTDCTAERRFVLHHRAGPAGASATPDSVALTVGPEGGLSEAEISACESAGFEPLTLGPRVLRTETAPLAALAILQARWGDMAPH
ncbi:16S rRNA (uracil(1498)-N(3))-methyltransferase [Parahaliea aestuarii]|uniref:Ribosomal RNA small subunit methyltransferase E n=1 Tax=Parahaliea aestuarii TaxID=1852021 RepID=A0A5C8ZUS8_9GAMM|nr:16S rRNA (uracil(1498)-N(3))-methyltransferase [Parahaliea aestuarii]TXS92248.1 16S rRNA (uracil(1498)-N(3))-methyltransferase [Parahaliea aestuarii]